MWRWHLPSGVAVLTTFPDLLFIFELVFGGLVWILIASSLVPLPLAQGWVMFVSVFCFISTTALLVLYIIGAHGEKTSWETLDAVYHSFAALFYLSASVLEALAAITMQDSSYFTYEQYLENVIATLLLGLRIKPFIVQGFAGVWVLGLDPGGWVMYISLTSFLVSLMFLLSYLLGFYKRYESWKVLVRTSECGPGPQDPPD